MNSMPNATHEFLANYPKSRTYTQNKDGLEERAGMKFNKTDTTKGVYLHGNLTHLICQYCGYKEEFTEEEIVKLENISGSTEIECKACLERREHCIKNDIRKKPIGVMHPGIIHYQQMHSDGAFIGKMGTSLSVDGVKKMVKMFARCENTYGKRILVNLTPPKKEWNDFFDYFYEGDCKDFIKELNKSTSKVNTNISNNISNSSSKGIDINNVNSEADYNSNKKSGIVFLNRKSPDRILMIEKVESINSMNTILNTSINTNASSSMDINAINSINNSSINKSSINTKMNTNMNSNMNSNMDKKNVDGIVCIDKGNSCNDEALNSAAIQSELDSNTIDYSFLEEVNFEEANEVVEDQLKILSIAKSDL